MYFLARKMCQPTWQKWLLYILTPACLNCNITSQSSAPCITTATYWTVEEGWNRDTKHSLQLMLIYIHGHQECVSNWQRANTNTRSIKTQDQNWNIRWFITSTADIKLICNKWIIIFQATMQNIWLLKLLKCENLLNIFGFQIICWIN